MKPELHLIDKDFNYYAYIDTYTSFQRDTLAWELGKFQLAMPYSPDVLPGRILFTDARHASIIRKIVITEAKGGLKLVATGTELKGIVSQRITVPDVISDTQYFGYDRFPAKSDPDAPAESVIKHYIDNHLVNPADPKRVFPRLVIAPDLGRGLSMRWQSRFEVLDKTLKGIGDYSYMGYGIYLDLDNQQFVFDVLPGKDSTSDTGTNPVIFSLSMDSADKMEYSLDQSGSNVGYTGGAGEDEDRLIQTVHKGDTMPEGFDRVESFIDGGSISDIDDLLYEGDYKLNQQNDAESLSGDVSNTGSFKYGADWDISDRVTILLERMGLQRDAQITGVKEAYSKTKTDIKAVIGQRKNNILDRVTKLEVVR